MSDAEWSRIEPLLGPRSGPPSKRGDRDFINAVIWRVKTACSGATCPRDSATGRRSTTASTVGCRPADGKPSSKPCGLKWMSAAPSRMPPSSERNRTPWAEKGGPKKCSGAFSRSFFNEGSRRHNDRR
ncbi:transposase [Corallococcus sp. ZKHCc1 1396]|uniref:Transposase n=1 Tax=Corallococcus soli TaxID=2710757 RepID=A0ABR9PKT3_9BACT|nr:transposase [Corallococcus soli]